MAPLFKPGDRFRRQVPPARVDTRMPMAVAVRIGGHLEQPGVETTFTENVSAHGARVLTVRRWRTDERLELRTLSGQFSTQARVAYCQPTRNGDFAIGLEFEQQSGSWVVG